MIRGYLSTKNQFFSGYIASPKISIPLFLLRNPKTKGGNIRWSKPTQRGTRRLAGIDLNKARNRHVVDAVVALSTRPGGFTLAQLAEAVQQRAGRSAKAYSSRNAAYDLAKLKGKKLVQ